CEYVPVRSCGAFPGATRSAKETLRSTPLPDVCAVASLRWVLRVVRAGSLRSAGRITCVLLTKRSLGRGRCPDRIAGNLTACCARHADPRRSREATTRPRTEPEP